MQAHPRLILLFSIITLVTLSCVGMPDRAVVNSPWLTGDSKTVCIDGDYAYIANLNGPIVVLDLEAPGGPDIVGRFDPAETPLRIDVCGDYLYSCSHAGTMEIVSIGSPYSPTAAGSVRIRSGVDDFCVKDGYAYIADEQLRIIDVDPPHAARLVKELGTTSSPGQIAVDGNYVYAAGIGTVADQFGVPTLGYVIDIIYIDPPENARLLSTINMFIHEQSGNFAVEGGYLYVMGNEFYIVDIDPLENMAIVGSTNYERPAMRVAVTEEYAYLTSPGTIQIIDILLKEEPLLIDYYIANDDALMVKVSGEYCHVSGREGGLRFIRPE